MQQGLTTVIARLNWSFGNRRNSQCKIQNSFGNTDNQTINHLNIQIMSKEMNWDNFVPTREIREYDMKLRESIRQREYLKVELAELEKRKRDIFWDVEYAMLTTGIKYFNTCSEYWLYKVESEYIKAEIAAEKSQE